MFFYFHGKLDSRGRSFKHHYPTVSVWESPLAQMFLRSIELGEHSHQCAGAHLGDMACLYPCPREMCVCVCVCVFKISYSEINLRGIRDTSIQSTKGTKKLM